MAEGGEFGYDDPNLDHDLDHDDDDDGEQEVDTTRPFQPTGASTPYHRREQHEMQTMQHEQSGLPDTSYEETPLLGDFLHHEERQSKLERFPRVDFKKLGPIGFSKEGARAEIVSSGQKVARLKFSKKTAAVF